MALLDAKELSKIINISVNTIYLWKAQKRIPYVQLGGAIRFDAEEIKTWLENQKVKVAA